ncbi:MULTISPECIES: type IV pilus modification protein PilV [Acinetobacter]|uniref:type IV pilus modification protein PilV n=1 Tax=Acinetobacter TaxID=469 RepID=UPI0002D03688|nr:MULTISPECIES: type IV pilus modification protein PilV [Acinetobacter]ENX12869.1 type IV pilus modification protein PilV [Acinetobacter sp. CIP 51.11]MCJ8511132.1 type IV pilus modification protein PilV [Acinetobacter lwoffii]
MNNMNTQKGVGLIEVLVALLLLAIGILGFVGLQLRAVDAANEATDRTIAINIARDLAERMRVNKSELAEYKTAINAKTKKDGCVGSVQSYVPNCSSQVMAQFDASQITQKAAEVGHVVKINNCVGSSLNCIYVAWGDTNIESNLNACIDSSTGAYVANSKCLVMEAF